MGDDAAQVAENTVDHLVQVQGLVQDVGDFAQDFRIDALLALCCLCPPPLDQFLLHGGVQAGVLQCLADGHRYIFGQGNILLAERARCVGVESDCTHDLVADHEGNQEDRRHMALAHEGSGGSHAFIVDRVGDG